MTTFPATVMLLGSGELGKEVAIAAQRLGCRVIACDRYAGAPAMQVADLAEVLPMTEPEALMEVVRRLCLQVVKVTIKSRVWRTTLPCMQLMRYQWRLNRRWLIQ